MCSTRVYSCDGGVVVSQGGRAKGVRGSKHAYDKGGSGVGEGRRGMRGLLAGRVVLLVRAGTSDEAGAALVARFDA